MTTPDISKFPDKVLTPSILDAVMPDQYLSERTEVTRTIGADIMLKALMSGDFRFISEYDKSVFGEFLGRVVTNAERQGIELPPRPEYLHTLIIK
jgi:hypothetical protein